MRIASASETVVVRQEIAAAPETVWRFLSDGALFASWIGAFAGAPPAAGTRIDARVGGKLRVEYPHSGPAVGEITAMSPPHRLCMTWGYEGAANEMPPGSSQIEILLTPSRLGTTVELRHTGIPTQAAREGHRGGWTHYLAMLTRAASSAQHSDRLSQTLCGWFEAWGEGDDDRRSVLLGQCCAPDVTVRTGFAATDDLKSLSVHIGESLRHMPGMRLSASGTPQELHGWVRFGWHVLAPNGAPMFQGENIAHLDLHSRIRTLVSFAG